MMSSIHSSVAAVSLPWIQKYSTAEFDLFQLALALWKTGKTKADKCIQVSVRASESVCTLNMLIFMLAQPMDTVGQMYEPLPPDAL